MPLLANHNAVVTGAGSGIGRAIALGYAREGARVVVLDINKDAAAETAQQILNAGDKAESFALDNQIQERSPVPFHPGALKYFKEKGVGG